MNDKLSRLSAQYLVALRRYLRRGSKASPQPAIRLGRQAAALGLEALDVAEIHEQALKTLAASGGLSRMRGKGIAHAQTFFAEAVAPSGQTPRAVVVAAHRQLNQTLRQRIVELKAATRRLQQGLRQHQAAENALRQSGKHRAQLLTKSRHRQEHLRHLTHLALAVQEEERKQISTELQDKIAQTLLGIHVRLISLKQKARNNTMGLKHEIASTQRLVIQSAKFVRRFARELNIHQPA